MEVRLASMDFCIGELAMRRSRERVRKKRDTRSRGCGVPAHRGCSGASGWEFDGRSVVFGYMHVRSRDSIHAAPGKGPDTIAFREQHTGEVESGWAGFVLL